MPWALNYNLLYICPCGRLPGRKIAYTNIVVFSLTYPGVGAYPGYYCNRRRVLYSDLTLTFFICIPYHTPHDHKVGS